MDFDDLGLPLGNETSSKTNLIDVQHVGVTAKLRDLKRALPECSSGAGSDGVTDLFNKTCKTTYNKLTGDDDSESTALTSPPLSAASTTAESSKLLYEMHAECTQSPSPPPKVNYRCGGGGGGLPKTTTRRNVRSSNNNHNNATYSRIEFQLYNKSSSKRTKKQCRCQQMRRARMTTTKKSSGGGGGGKAAIASEKRSAATKRPPFFERLRISLREMCASKAPILSQTTYHPGTMSSPSFSRPSTTAMAGGASQQQHHHQQQHQPRDCVYTFEHGCTDYLRVADCPPQLLSNVLAERATYFATRFWAEFFGGLHIGVSFVVTFFLQTYRFLLYSLINTLLVGLLQMTSDYLLKPVLTVAFNGFLQPPLIFIHNILSSIRDILEPIADALNNFMKPLATVGRSIRLVQATYNKKKFVKDV